MWERAWWWFSFLFKCVSYSGSLCTNIEPGPSAALRDSRVGREEAKNGGWTRRGFSPGGAGSLSQFALPLSSPPSTRCYIVAAKRVLTLPLSLSLSLPTGLCSLRLSLFLSQKLRLIGLPVFGHVRHVGTGTDPNIHRKKGKKNK